MTISVETDHKPLIALFQKPLNDCPLRIQRMMIRLQRNTLNVMYTPGKLMYMADTLSRAVDPKEPANTKMDDDVKAYVDMITSALPVADGKMELIKTETNKDDTLGTLCKTIIDGWPNCRRDCSPVIQEYWNCRAELSVVKGIIYKGSKIVIPKSLRGDMLKKIHAGNLGIEKCKKRGREVMYWPRINQDVTNEMSNCSICLIYQASNPAEPLKPHPVPDRPSQKVGVDLFVSGGKDNIVVADYYSLHPEVCRLHTTTAETVITSRKAIISRHGVPSEVFTDNGPQFSNMRFRQFATEWDFVHTTSSPH